MPAEPFLAPLNDFFTLVGGPSSFGPIHVERIIFDSGCTSVLLPWPGNPDSVLIALLQNPTLKCGTSLSGAVGSDHATFHVVAPTAAFPVLLDGHDLGVKISELRFVITEEAKDWLVEHDPSLWTGFKSTHVHQTNLDFALVGQTILSQLLCVQVFNKGLLILCSSVNVEFLPPTQYSMQQLAGLASDLYRKEIETEHYARLRDLRDRRATKTLAEMTRSPGRNAFGKRIDHFGIGFRG
jgi:hypothetical protein